MSSEEQFTPAQEASAIRQWLEWGESAERKGHQGGYFSGGGWAARCLRFSLERLLSPRPIPMVLHCPDCGVQHVDRSEPCSMGVGCEESGVCYASAHGRPDECMRWDNPPHKSHKCLSCGTIWRPADVPTEGVASIQTQGKADTPRRVTPRWDTERLLWLFAERELPPQESSRAMVAKLKNIGARLAAGCSLREALDDCRGEPKT